MTSVIRTLLTQKNREIVHQQRNQICSISTLSIVLAFAGIVVQISALQFGQTKKRTALHGTNKGPVLLLLVSLPSLKVHRVTLRQVQKQKNAGVNASLQTKIVYLQIINILSWNLLLVLIPLLHIPTAQISLIPSWIPTSADASVLSQPMTVLRMQNSIQTNVVAKRRLLALVIKTMIVGAMHSIKTLRQMTLLLC